MINKTNINQCWHLRLLTVFSLVVGLQMLALPGNRAFAQSNIVPDDTLGAERSQVVPLDANGLAVDQITGGAVRGSNLFHSFREFNVSAGRGAYFFSPNAEIQNILARVTGSNRSEILGTLGTFGNSQPNLYLINPNGIVFGENASLDLGGSFVATTANAVKLGETGFFSVTEPARSNLLSVNPSSLFYNAVNSQAQIVNRSRATATVLGRAENGDPNRRINGLQVLDGKSLLLVGGNVSLDGGRIFAPGGKVELGGLAEAGSIGLGVDGNIFSLSFPNGVQRGDIFLNRARVDTLAGGGGSIAVNARNVDISGRSRIVAGIEQGLGTLDSQAGDITLDAKGEVQVGQGSLIANIIFSNATGKGGDVRITTGSLSVNDGAVLSASTLGQGDAGSVFIDVSDAVLLSNGSIGSTVETRGVGNGGNINIKAELLTLTNGSQLQALVRQANETFTAGRGNAGSLNIDVRGEVSVTGRNNRFPSGIFTSVETGVIGNGGDISVKAGSFKLRDGALVSARTAGWGNAGSVFIDASDVVSLANNSYIFSTVESGAEGNGGNINIKAGSLTLTDGGQLLASVRETNETFAGGRGKAGNVNIDVRGEVLLAGERNGFPSAFFSSLGRGAIGNGGNINIKSGSLTLRDGAQLVANTSGEGDAGNIQINAIDAVTVSGTSQEKGFSSALLSDTNTNSTGKGGNITVNTNMFRVLDGANLNARTANNRKGGDITVNANIFEAMGGGQLTTTTSGSGDAGKIMVNATDQVIISGSDANFNNRISKFPDQVGNIGATSGFVVNSSSSGTTGDIEINSPKITLNNGGKLNANSASGSGGNINLNVGDLLLLRRGGEISTNAGGTLQQGGDGGNININSKFIIAIPQENSDITANAVRGRGGNVEINSQGIFGIEPRAQRTDKSDITASSELGVTGNVNLNTPDNSAIQNSLTELPDNQIDTNALIANSCIARTNPQNGTFFITGSGGLPLRPGDAPLSPYSTGAVQSIPTNSEKSPISTSRRPWKIGDLVVEPQGVYQLPNGQLILTRECSK